MTSVMGRSMWPTHQSGPAERKSAIRLITNESAFAKCASVLGTRPDGGAVTRRIANPLSLVRIQVRAPVRETSWNWILQHAKMVQPAAVPEVLDMTTIDQILTGKVAPLGLKAAPSGIDKYPVTGRIFLGREGLTGDAQGDRKHHGGPDKALHHYAF